MGSRFDYKHTIFNPGSPDWRLGQRDTQRSARFRQHPHPLVLNQQDQALVDQQDVNIVFVYVVGWQH